MLSLYLVGIRWGQGFNGAADFHRRKYLVPAGRGFKFFLLQWGRRFSSAEIYTVRVADTLLRFASMGPPIFIGGNYKVCGTYRKESPALQWGRRFSSAEIDGQTQISNAGLLLQWGRRFSSAEMLTFAPSSYLLNSFNGAADFHRRKCRERN